MSILRVSICGLIIGWVFTQPILLAEQAKTHDHPKPQVLAPGYADLEFTPPKIGTYQLPPMGTAGDGEVLDTSGRAVSLDKYLGDKIVVMSFIYTTCGDVNGCPLATHVLRGLQDRILEQSELKDQVRLLSISFDPGHDTPAVLRDYSEYFKNDKFDWQFLTTASDRELTPLLDTYGQWVIKDYDEQGNYLGTMSHVLRVFLIDQKKRIRNIYSVSFLHVDTVTNDILTLLLETQKKASVRQPS